MRFFLRRFMLAALFFMPLPLQGAERSAIAAMVARGLRDPVAVAVVGSGDGDFGRPCPPCGACRQILVEFNPDMRVVLASPEGPLVYSAHGLLPHSFGLRGGSP